jgi:hypothetical protein
MAEKKFVITVPSVTALGQVCGNKDPTATALKQLHFHRPLTLKIAEKRQEKIFLFAVDNPAKKNLDAYGKPPSRRECSDCISR